MSSPPEAAADHVSITQFDMSTSEPGALPDLSNGDLEVGTAFARGGMGAIHQAVDPGLGRVVALKVIGDNIASHPRLRARFLTEAQVTAQLDHPNIVPVYGWQSSELGKPAFTMKLIQGQTLSDVVGSPDTEWTLHDRLEVFVKVCDAMAYSHERGVVHRDLKPDNVMVGRHGEVYVLDWGVAKVIGVEDGPVDDMLTTSTDSAVLTQAGAALGTPAYMSPEQARGDEVGPASDQYALGLVLQELLTGKVANPGKTSASAIITAQDAGRRPMSGSRDLEAIVNRATQLLEKDRYVDVHELAEDVRRFMHGEELMARPDNILRKLWRWSTKNPTATLAGLLGIVISAAAVVITSLVLVLLVQQEAKTRGERISEQVAAVGRRAHEIDTELLRYKALLDQVAVRTETLWNDKRPVDGPIYRRVDFRDENSAPADFTGSDVYDMPVSFLDPLMLTPPGVELADVEAELRRILPLRTTFREVFLRSHDEEAVDLTATQQDRLLRTDGVPPAWVYLGLDNGVLVNYPGHPTLSDEYDPRKRPWYTGTPHTRGAHWGVPYQDDSGYSILVPCNRALFDADGEFFGVAGFDVTLDTVIDMMDLEMDGVVHAWFIDENGEIVVSDDQRGLNLGAGLHENTALERKDFPYPEVHAEMMAGAPFGHHDVHDGELVFDRLVSLGWTYAVLFEE